MQRDDPDSPDDGRRVLARALGASGVGLWTWDVERDVITWDETLRQIVGAAPKTSAEYLAAIDPEDRGKVWASIERALQTGVFEDLEHRFRRPGGEMRWALCKGRADRDASGRVVRLLGGTIDVTERHLLNERLLTAHRLESVGRLAAGIAHDFNNMLTAIVGRAASAAARVPEGLDAATAIREDLDEIRKAAERSAQLTGQLLAFAKKQAHAPVRVHLDALLRDITPTLRAMVGGDVALVLDLRSKQRVHADPKQLEQVLVSLVMNAGEAMPDGGTVLVQTADGVAPDGATRVELSVSDTGVGIPPEHLARVFEPFFTTKAPGMGTGLGLATCYGIVAQHRGNISVDSAPGRGTTVRIELPVSARPGTAPHLPVTQPAGERGAPATVLVVEDEDLVRTTAVRGLQIHGFRVMSSNSGPEALAILRTTAIDLVLSDIVMPQMSGQELAAAIRAVWPSMKILFMSGYSEADLGGIELVAKPFTPKVLAERVKAVLARSA
ncbi:MAG: ATP-binding protein [Myxococcota bacterium]